MGRVELNGTPIKSIDDIANMPKNANRTERHFAQILIERTSLSVEYEPTRFEDYATATVPDFRVVNPRTGIETFIEVTISKSGKGKQKRIMEKASPGTRYVVLFGDNLRKTNEGYQKFKSKDAPAK